MLEVTGKPDHLPGDEKLKKEKIQQLQGRNKELHEKISELTQIITVHETTITQIETEKNQLNLEVDEHKRSVSHLGDSQ